jgi:hypothetical protein
MGGRYYFPALPNVSEPSKGCSQIFYKATPPDVAKWTVTYNAIKDLPDKMLKPGLVDKLMPSESTMDALGKSAPGIGMGVANIVSAIQDNISIAAIISSAVTAGLGELGDMRSETSDQLREVVCEPDSSKLFIYRTAETLIVDVKSDTRDFGEAVLAALTKEKKAA